MIQQYSAGILVYKKHAGHIHYLLLHYLSGHWDFPKGKLEKAETPQEAAIRETREETGLDVEIMPGFEKSLEYYFKERGTLIKKKVTYFVGITSLTEVKLSYEHQAYKWVSYEQAYQALTYKNSIEILVAAHKFLQEIEM